MSSRRNAFAEIISPEGGTAKVGGCRIIFPPGAVKMRTRFDFSISHRCRWIGGTLGITPVLKWEPAMKFEVPVKVQLSTWCRTDARELRVSILTKDGEFTDDMKATDTRFHAGDETIEFECFQSRYYWGVVKSSYLKSLTLSVIPAVFYTPREGNVVALLRVDEEALRISTRRDLTSRTFRQAPIELNTLSVRPGDTVSIRLKCSEPENFIFEPDVQSFTIGEQFALTLYSFLSFSLSPCPEENDVLKCSCEVEHKNRTEVSDYILRWPERKSSW